LQPQLYTHSYARSQAYLIAEDGRVALYRGVPGSFAGVSLSWRSEVSTVTVDLLDPLTASRLATGIRVEGIDTRARFSTPTG
jgi:protein phosphatase